MLDSAAVRLSVSPTRDLSAQVSWARLDSPEALEPEVSVQRATASAMWNRRLAERASDVAITAAAGHNDPSLGPSTHAGLLEAAAMRHDEHTVFARAELVTRSGHDLALPAELAEDTFAVGSFSAGFVHDFPQLGAIVPGVGVVGMIDVIGSALEPIYDTRTPWGGMVFVRVRPPRMKPHAGMPGMAM